MEIQRMFTLCIIKVSQKASREIGTHSFIYLFIFKVLLNCGHEIPLCVYIYKHTYISLYVFLGTFWVLSLGFHSTKIQNTCRCFFTAFAICVLQDTYSCQDTASQEAELQRYRSTGQVQNSLRDCDVMLCTAGIPAEK